MLEFFSFLAFFAPASNSYLDWLHYSLQPISNSRQHSVWTLLCVCSTAYSTILVDRQANYATFACKIQFLLSSFALCRVRYV